MNIISWTNAGRRQYGDNHWLWAIWRGVEQTADVAGTDELYLNWNNHEPAVSGFCSSEKEARFAAWAALKALVPDSRDQCAVQRCWASQMLRKKQDRERRPCFSRCRVGPNAWLWVVYAQDDVFEESRISLARGVAVSAEAAYDDAEQAVGPVECWGNWLATSLRKKEAAIKRSQKPTSVKGAAPLEFAYQCYRDYSDFDGSPYDSITPHRILKRTKTRVYVEREAYQKDRPVSGDWRDYREGSFILNRQEFETTGKARRSRRWHDIYYADLALYHAECRTMASCTDCYVGLGVPPDATVAEVQSAYRRLARQTHPDVGGDAESFKRVQASFERAMELAAEP